MNLTQSYVNTNVISATVDNTNTQTITINITNADGCPIDATQSITASTVLEANINEQNTTQFANDLATSIDSTAKQNAAMQNGLLAATGGNDTNAVNSVTNKVNEIVKQTLTTTNILNTASRTYNKQTGTVTMVFCKNSPIKINQSIVSNIISHNILTAVGDALMKDSTISGIVSKADQTSSEHNSGLDDLATAVGNALANIVGAFTGPMGAAYVASAVLSCICCLALLYFLLSPAGQKATTNVSGAGAQAIAR